MKDPWAVVGLICALPSWICAFIGCEFVDPWVRPCVGSRVRGFMGSWVREFGDGFVGSWIGSCAFGFVWVSLSKSFERLSLIVHPPKCGHTLLVRPSLIKHTIK